jgi:hypothetical protein
MALTKEERKVIRLIIQSKEYDDTQLDAIGSDDAVARQTISDYKANHLYQVVSELERTDAEIASAQASKAELVKLKNKLEAV